MAHCEYGFLKINPNGALSYSSTQNTGLSAIEEGKYDNENKTISLESSSILRSSFNNPPEVKKVIIKISIAEVKSI